MLSIIIPTLDEAKLIGKTLSHLQRQPGDFEVLVVDGGSRDATRKIAEQLGVRVVKAERGITEQLTAGLLAASGDLFLTLHADCLLPQEAILALNDLEEHDHALAGAFRHRYDSVHPLFSLQASINNMNARLFGLYCGEQGIWFNKDALNAIKTLPHAFVLEDRKLSKALKQAGVTTMLLHGPITSSARRYMRGLGIGPFFAVNWAHALHGLGVSDYKLKKYFPGVR